MSLTLDPTPARDLAPPDAPPEAPRRRRTWALVVLAVALAGSSAGLRVYQQTRVDSVLRSGRVSPFPLAEVPAELGPWAGYDDELDPRIAAAAGATDAVFRTYVNAQTGVRLGVILLYGPAADVFLHAPDLCYPASGYGMLGSTEVRQVDLGDGTRAPFHAQTFARGEGGQREAQRVFYTWRYAGRWTPAQVNYKQYERMPGMFKVHLARAAIPGERFEARDPCEDFLSHLMPDLERRLLASGRPN